MKKLTKIFASLVALVAVSCATDTTEELGVDLDNNEALTEITLSLEESRTQLGEMAGDIYPLYWSEGDKIAINGVVSNALSASEAGSAAATFSVAGTPEKPYCIAYPAAAANQVVFADRQVHAGNSTFASGLTTMYAYSEDGTEIQLNHLTSVLKFGVVGSAKLALAQISNVNRKPIAGAFDFDFEKGEATATAASKEVIEYSFGEGVQLSSEPTYIHAVVPAGEYDELYVTLYDTDGGVMYATIKSDETKPLVAGKVREFSNSITYAATDAVFVVKDVASLKAFAEQAATLAKDVLFVADVDMTGEAWTPIEGYAKKINGNGYAIKGLTAPLFGVTNASIKGLHLRDVNINETVTPNVGAFARKITASASIAPAIENCSVSGKITVNCANYTYKEEAQYHEFTVGSLVGTLFGVNVNNCSSSAEIDIVQCVKQGTTKEIRPAIGGVFGAVTVFSNDGAKVYSNVSHCSNSGDIKIANGTYNGTTDYVYVSTGGVIGITFKDNLAGKYEYLDNSGDITIDANFTRYETRVGGVIGWAYSEDLAHLRNSGTLKYNSGQFHYLHMGGIVGYGGSAAPIIDAINTGDVIVNEEVVQRTSLVVGGIVGYHQEDSAAAATKDNDVIKDSINEGTISVGGNIPVNTANCYFRVGGICGWSQNAVINATNKGAINISGSLYNAHTNAHSIAVGGIVGYHTVTGSTNTTNEGDITSTANVGYAQDDDGDNCRMWIGGVDGYSASASTEARNKGNISVSGSHHCLYVGGLFGYIGSTLTTGENSGTVTIEPNTTVASYLMTGGICGWFNNSVTDAKNSGTVTISEGVSAGNNTYFSGGLAYSQSGAENVVVQRLTNEGNVLVNGTYDAKLYISGCLGYWNEDAAGQYLRGADNYGSITTKSTFKGSECCVGGIVSYMRGKGSRGLHNHKSGTLNLDITATTGKIAVGGVAYGLRHQLSAAAEDESANGNDADIILTGSSATTFDVGGIICIPNNYHRYDAYNKGNINITGAKVGTDLRVGGSESNHNYGKTNRNYYNTGNITVDATTKVQGSVYMGGLSGGESLLQYDSAPHNFENCYNSGNIKFSGEAGLSGTGVIKMGGAFACFMDSEKYDPTLTFSNGFTNSGSVTFDGILHSNDKKIYMGGLIGHLTLQTKDLSSWTGNVVNQGTITLAGESNGAPAYVGGMIGALEILENTAPAAIGAKLYQFGDVVYAGSAEESWVGGIMAQTNTSIANAECYCTINAPSAKNLGAIMGSARTEGSVVATNCKVGGSLIDTYDVEEDEYIETKLSASNFYNYIYGSGKNTDWSGTDNYDGCSYISAAPAL